MKNFSAWYEQRAKETVEGTPLPKSGGEVLERIEASYGADSRKNFVQAIMEECDPLIIQYASALAKNTDSEEITKALFDALVSQEKRDLFLSQAPSDILRKSANRLLCGSLSHAFEFISFSDLEKMSVDAASWKRILKHHTPEGEDLVSHKSHIQATPAPQEYQSLLSSPEKIKSSKGIRNGVSAKMIHDVPLEDNKSMKVMAKPYHKKIESATRSWCKNPIMGWATMATKALFHAGGIGHLCEDVSAHEHEKVPLTVHKFAEDMIPVADAYQMGHDRISGKYCADHDDVLKIATMDFLANNGDRHAGNLLVDKDPATTDARGYNRILAIDHERNFQYHKPVKFKALKWAGIHGPAVVKPNEENPYDYVKHSSLKALKAGFGGFENYLQWWKEKSPAIKEEFNKQLMYVNSPSLREHLKNNFDLRAGWMDQFVQHVQDNGLEYHEQAFDDLPGVRIHQQYKPRPEKVQKVLEKLPDEPRAAFDAIADWLHSKNTAHYGDFELVREALQKKVEGLPSGELWKLYLHGVQSPKYKHGKWNDFRDSFHPSRVVPNYIQNQQNDAIKRQFVNEIEKMDPHQKENSNAGYWETVFRGIMKERKVA